MLSKSTLEWLINETVAFLATSRGCTTDEVWFGLASGNRNVIARFSEALELGLETISQPVKA